MKKFFKMFILAIAVTVMACNPMGVDTETVNPDSFSSASASTIDPTQLNPTGNSQTQTVIVGTGGNEYTVTSTVSWYGNSTTWTYTITAASDAKNISHVSFLGIDGCFLSNWTNKSSQPLTLTQEGNTGCVQDMATQVFKSTDDANNRTKTFTFTFDKALAVDAEAATLFVKAGSVQSGAGCSSLSIPGPSCTELTISGKVEKKVCVEAQTTIVPAEGVTVTAQQGSANLTAVTDSNGSYSFANVGGEWSVTIPNADAVKVVAGPENGTNNFLFDTRTNGTCAQIVGSAKIIDCVNETKRTQSYQNAGVTFDTQTAASNTDANGGYKFSNVSVASHTIIIGGVSKTVSVTSENGVFNVDEIVVDSRPNGSCAVIIGNTKIIDCFQQASRTNPYIGITATCGHESCTTLAPDGSFKFLNAPKMSHTIIVDGATKSVEVTADEGIFNLGEIVVDKTNGGICGTTEVLCSLSQGYWFSKPNAVWPDGTVTLGGKSYTQAEGKAIWNTSNSKGLLNAKAAFTQAAAIRLSKVAPSASVMADVKIVEAYLASINKLTPTTLPPNAKTGLNVEAGKAAGRIGTWIQNNHCNE